MTRFVVRHVTEYRYSAEVAVSQSTLHLTPRETDMQRVISSTITSVPAPSDRLDYVDAFGNPSTYIAVDIPHDRWTLTVESVVDVEQSGSLDSGQASGSESANGPSWEAVVDVIRSFDAPSEAVEASLASPEVILADELATYARLSFLPSIGIVAGAQSLVQQIFADFTFDPTATEVSTPIMDVYRDRRGVCQDFAHLMIGCLRSIGLSARYVSGYLETDPPPDAVKLIGTDASHAWVSVFVPGTGWLDADPTNGVLPSGRHVTVGWGRDYTDVAPSRGVVFGPPTTQDLTVGVDVTRIAIS
jgi:transglutaminase-like putative cysteine protease